MEKCKEGHIGYQGATGKQVLPTVNAGATGPTGRWGHGFGPDDVPLQERLDELTTALVEHEHKNPDADWHMQTALGLIASNKHADENTRNSARAMGWFLLALRGHPWASGATGDACMGAIASYAAARNEREKAQKEADRFKRQQVSNAVGGKNISLTKEQAYEAHELVNEYEDTIEPMSFDEALAIVLGFLSTRS